MTPADRAVLNAARDVNRILAELEASLGLEVQDVQLRSIDVTTLDSEGSAYLRSVVITTRRQSASKWDLIQ